MYKYVSPISFVNNSSLIFRRYFQKGNIYKDFLIVYIKTCIFNLQLHVKKSTMTRHVNTRLLGVNLIIFSGFFTLLFIISTLALSSEISEAQMALIILGIIFIMIGGMLVVNSRNSKLRRVRGRKRRGK